MNKEEVFKKVVEKWGVNYNLDQLSEEMSELNVAIKHFKKCKKDFDFNEIATEIADVKICLELLEYMFRYHASEIAEEYNYKFNRMMERAEL